jgi:hypothetical protein
MRATIATRQASFVSLRVAEPFGEMKKEYNYV